MGGRVAEELSTFHVVPGCLYKLTLPPVYGAENVTSGASSDIKHATDTATRMVKVRSYRPLRPRVELITVVVLGFLVESRSRLSLGQRCADQREEAGRDRV
jgi:ATP-dependent Zn protease